jgi:hypothetical protein
MDIESKRFRRSMLDGTIRSESFVAALDEADHVDGLDSCLKHEQQDISNMADFWEALEISFRGGATCRMIRMT